MLGARSNLRDTGALGVKRVSRLGSQGTDNAPVLPTLYLQAPIIINYLRPKELASLPSASVNTAPAPPLLPSSST